MANERNSYNIGTYTILLLLLSRAYATAKYVGYTFIEMDSGRIFWLSTKNTTMSHVNDILSIAVNAASSCNVTCLQSNHFPQHKFLLSLVNAAGDIVRFVNKFPVVVNHTVQHHQLADGVECIADAYRAANYTTLKDDHLNAKLVDWLIPTVFFLAACYLMITTIYILAEKAAKTYTRIHGDDETLSMAELGEMNDTEAVTDSGADADSDTNEATDEDADRTPLTYTKGP